MAKKYNKGRKQKPNVNKKFREAFNVESASELGSNPKKDKKKITSQACSSSSPSDSES